MVNNSCNFKIYAGDCKDSNGVKGRCVSGAITNYTDQLLTYGNSSADGSSCNAFLNSLLDFFMISILTIITK